MYVPLRTQLTKRVPWFFGPAFEHLEFLSREQGFSWNGENPGGPDAYARLVFTDEHLEISVLSWMPMDLPSLSAVRLLPRRAVLDLKALLPQAVLDNAPGDFYERWKRVHPLNKEGRAAVDREFEAAVADRMVQLAMFLREHVETLRTAARPPAWPKRLLPKLHASPPQPGDKNSC